MQFGLRQAMFTLQRNEMLHFTPFYKVHNINALIMLSLLILFVFSKERLCCLNKDGKYNSIQNLTVDNADLVNCLSFKLF
jgi:hypothetical protein